MVLCCFYYLFKLKKVRDGIDTTDVFFAEKVRILIVLIWGLVNPVAIFNISNYCWALAGFIFRLKITDLINKKVVPNKYIYTFTASNIILNKPWGFGVLGFWGFGIYSNICS